MWIRDRLTIGLGALMVLIEGQWLRTGDRQYEEMARFWTKVFAVNFGMGVATGIVMEFEFGTNWAAYSRYVGDVFGSALAAEGIFAFFLESGFLAVLVFGWDPRRKEDAFFQHFDGVSRKWILVCVDRDRQQLDADPRRVRNRWGGNDGTSGNHGLLGDGLQPVERRTTSARLDR